METDEGRQGTQMRNRRETETDAREIVRHRSVCI